MTSEERTDLMVQILGEACTKAAAGRALGRSVNTVKAMLEDGRLEDACDGTRVDVRSIARYISKKKEMDFEARVRRYKTRRNTNYVV